MPLYKYVIAERIDVLQNELIRFSQPSALNDPWDLRPHVERVFTDDDIDQHVLAPMKPESDMQMIDFLSRTIDDFNKTQGVTEISLDEIRKVVTEANQEFPDELKQLLDVAFAETAEKMKQIVPQIAEIMPEAIESAVGVLSLTEKSDHPLMWSHYANNHSGLVLGFDETSEFFRSPRYGQPDDVGGARRVKYSSERPKFDPLVSVHMLDNMTDEDAISFFDKMFFTKSQAWDYEQEWRMIKGLKQAVKILQIPTGDVYLFSVPPSCIASVILGQRMIPETRRQVIDFVRTDKRYSHVNLFQASSSTHKFAIEIQPL